MGASEVKASARIMNIERCSTEDGPGIRTTVFMKGCRLRCIWCSNPESQSFEKEILFKSVRCTGCGRCRELCESGAIELKEGFGMITDPAKCTMCLRCIDGCYADARSLQGQDMTADELMKILERDDAYYRNSSGGITFSGGEPVMYAGFIKECAEQIHERGWTVLIETCGHVEREKLETAAGCSDIIYCDFKHFDPEEHRRCTGEDNRLILENIKWLDANYKGELQLRYPYIPGYNSRPEDIEGFLSFARELKKVRKVAFLPFHRLGLDKYRGLGRRYLMGDMPSLKLKDIEFLREYEKKYGLEIQIY